MGTAIQLCGKCAYELQRKLSLKGSPLGDDMHRGASKGMVKKPDPKAEKVRRRKERKRAKQIRSALAARDMKAVVKLYIDCTKLPPAPPPDQECPECRRLNAPRGIVPLHIFAA